MAYKYGIDFGTTNSSIAICYEEDNKKTIHTIKLRDKHPNYVLPSVAFITEDKIFVGDDAVDAFCDPEYFAKGQFIKQIKIMLEKKRNNLSYTVGNKTVSGEDIIAEIFRRLRIEAQKHTDYLELDMDGVVLGVPVAFDEVAKDVLRNALYKAGFYKSLSEAESKTQFVSEPLAVAINYGLDLKQDKTVFIFDFGGGTLDVALVNLKQNIENDILHPHEVIAKDRLTKAGEEINRLFFVNSICPKYGRTKLARQFNVPEDWTADEIWDWMLQNPIGIRFIDAIEECKCDLSYKFNTELSFIGGTVALEPKKFTRDDFDLAISDVLDDIRELIENCIEEGIDKEAIENQYDVDQAIIAGGSSLIPVVQTILYDFFNKHLTVKKESEVLSSIVRGLAIVGFESSRLVDDVVDCDYGIWDDKNENLIVILEKGTPIKQTKFNQFTLDGKYRRIKCEDTNASHINIKVYQKTPDSLNRLGTITIHELGGFRYRIYMTISEDCGTLDVMLYDSIKSSWIKIPTKESSFIIK